MIHHENITEKPGYIPKIELSREDKRSLYKDALIVIGFQITLIYLIAFYYQKNNQVKWKIEPL